MLEVNIFLVYIRMERDILTKMKLTFREQQPIRLWFLYLQTCLRDEVLNKKVNKNFYKEWIFDNLIQNTNVELSSHSYGHIFANQVPLEKFKT